MTLAAPVPELSIVRVFDQQGTTVHIHGNGEAYEVEFSDPPRVDTVMAREIQAVVWVPPDDAGSVVLGVSGGDFNDRSDR
ncbi:DUF4926 domain-containing protein [Skermanella mucosa]|uniref:hypothetical protein n=1 Tax=Skermanella mucosa TaxID=1789672 RepID=UPI00192CCD92|nr:hypothetical protein [Skermanella mucosa]UEM18468.1 DUF4926 domain-containing protein [Skermanella mucosa]